MVVGRWWPTAMQRVDAGRRRGMAFRRLGMMGAVRHFL
ncbi:putative protein without homology [Propionibacterium freudenreichii subsp. shermanii]|nr:putative protein without homology [Propionibacterium freudenreichii subsp. shermanii]